MPSNPLLTNTLLSVLTFLKHKADERGLKPVITVAKLTNLLHSSGLNLTYQQLADLTKDHRIAPSIKSINKNQIELNLGNEEPIQPEIAPEMPDMEDENDEENQNSEESSDEEFNPNDFNMDEENSGEEGQPEDKEHEHKDETVANMASRALARAD